MKWIAVIDHDGISLVRKAIIRCDLAQITNDCWEIKQMLQHLQDIVQRYSVNLQDVQFNNKISKNFNTQLFLSTRALIHGFNTLVSIWMLIRPRKSNAVREYSTSNMRQITSNQIIILVRMYYRFHLQKWLVKIVPTCFMCTGTEVTRKSQVKV